jgi:hypothetical protein
MHSCTAGQLVAKGKVKMIAAIGDEKVSGWAREAPVTDAEIDEKSRWCSRQSNGCAGFYLK